MAQYVGFGEHGTHRLFALRDGGLASLGPLTLAHLARFNDEAAARRFAANQWPGQVDSPAGPSPRGVDPFAEEIYYFKAAVEPDPDIG